MCYYCLWSPHFLARVFDGDQRSAAHNNIITLSAGCHYTKIYLILSSMASFKLPEGILPSKCLKESLCWFLLQKIIMKQLYVEVSTPVNDLYLNLDSSSTLISKISFQHNDHWCLSPYQIVIIC